MAKHSEHWTITVYTVLIISASFAHSDRNKHVRRLCSSLQLLSPSPCQSRQSRRQITSCSPTPGSTDPSLASRRPTWFRALGQRDMGCFWSGRVRHAGATTSSPSTTREKQRYGSVCGYSCSWGLSFETQIGFFFHLETWKLCIHRKYYTSIDKGVWTLSTVVRKRIQFSQRETSVSSTFFPFPLCSTCASLWQNGVSVGCSTCASHLLWTCSVISDSSLSHWSVEPPVLSLCPAS